MERIECDGTEWIGGKGREGGIERHDMVGSKIRSWREEAMGKSKLEMTGRLMESKCKARCVWRDCKRQRRIMSRLRGGTQQNWQLKWEGFTDKFFIKGIILC